MKIERKQIAKSLDQSFPVAFQILFPKKGLDFADPDDLDSLIDSFLQKGGERK